MASASRGRLKPRPIQKRRVIFLSSEFSGSEAETVMGSSAIPQIGHGPGRDRTISGCMGQVYSFRPSIARLTSPAGKTSFLRYVSGWIVNFSRHGELQKK